MRDGLVDPSGFFLLSTPFVGESGHLLLEGLPVVLLGLCPNIPTGGQDVAMLSDLLPVVALLQKPRISA